MKFGTVKFFSEKDGKNFGFAKQDEGGNEVFIHIFQAKKIKKIGTDIAFSDESFPCCPQPGDRIVYLTTETEKGIAASAWTLETEYYKHLERYRIKVRHGCWVDHSTTREIVIWEGYDLDDAREKFPKPKNNINAVSDPLYPCYKHYDGFLAMAWFEAVEGDGEWKRIKDPR